MKPEVVAIFIPIVSSIVLGLVVWAFFHYRHKTRVQVQDTIRVALEKGHELSPELLDRMAGPPRHEDRDLRFGLMAIAIGLAFGLFGFALDDPDALRAMLGIGAFPAFVGIAYLIMWRIGKRGA